MLLTRKKKVLNSLITIGKYNEFMKNILMLSEEKESSYVCVSNVHMVIESYKDAQFREVVNSAVMATPDGMPIAKSLCLLYGIKQDRVAGMDLMPDLFRECESCGKSVFLYGSTEGVINEIIRKAGQEYPNLKIYSYPPSFRQLNQQEKDEIVKIINSANPDFVFVALGCPKQEKWMAEHIGKIKSCMIGLGGAFDVYAGIKNRAPRWMQHYSLEWLYRLVQDPLRLWKRYLLTNTLFVFLLVMQIIKVRIIKK